MKHRENGKLGLRLAGIWRSDDDIASNPQNCIFFFFYLIHKMFIIITNF